MLKPNVIKFLVILTFAFFLLSFFFTARNTLANFSNCERVAIWKRSTWPSRSVGVDALAYLKCNRNLPISDSFYRLVRDWNGIFDALFIVCGLTVIISPYLSKVQPKDQK